jgi:hypothetical protein
MVRRNASCAAGSAARCGSASHQTSICVCSASRLASSTRFSGAKRAKMSAALAQNAPASIASLGSTRVSTKRASTSATFRPARST